jgi:hypothetical protein
MIEGLWIKLEFEFDRLRDYIQRPITSSTNLVSNFLTNFLSISAVTWKLLLAVVVSFPLSFWLVSGFSLPSWIAVVIASGSSAVDGTCFSNLGRKPIMFGATENANEVA